MEKESKCPYCGTPFEKRPTRKTKCLQCSNFVLSKKLPDGQQFLIKESEIEEIERMRSAYYEKQHEEWVKTAPFRLKKEIIDFVIECGFKENEYDNFSASLGEIAEIEKTFMFYRDVIIPRADGNHHLLHGINLAALRMFRNKGIDTLQIDTDIQENELMKFRSAGFSKVKINCVGENDCPECKKTNRKVITIETAICGIPYPSRKCVSDGHVMYFEPIV